MIEMVNRISIVLIILVILLNGIVCVYGEELSELDYNFSDSEHLFDEMFFNNEIITRYTRIFEMYCDVERSLYNDILTDKFAYIPEYYFQFDLLESIKEQINSFNTNTESNDSSKLISIIELKISYASLLMSKFQLEALENNGITSENFSHIRDNIIENYMFLQTPSTDYYWH